MKNFQADIDAINAITAVPTILNVVCRTTGMGFAAVARVTDDKWIACSVRDEINFGLVPGGELKLETTICHEIRQSGQGVVIDHVATDDLFCNHHTPAFYGFQSYISMPIILRDGTFFGTLCAIDPRPAKLNNPEIIGMFRLYADLISFHLHALDQMAITEEKLSEERKTAELRDQFIAILGHDLRNPVGAILNVAQLLLRMNADAKTTRLANILLDSSYRMKGLIENIMDFANGHLGGGIVLNRNNDEPLEDILKHVISECEMVWPQRTIETEFDLTEPVNCDGKRVAQLFSNLLANALTHGKNDSPVKVKVISNNGEFILSIANAGNKIPFNAMSHLFQPFYRGGANSGKDGLGLGLFIVSKIAQAHGGEMDVISTEEETIFTLTMPCDCTAEAVVA